MPQRIFAIPSKAHKVRILVDDEDPESGVDLTVIDEITLKEGRGPTFRRRIVKFSNVQDWEPGQKPSRTETIRKVKHVKRFPGLEWKGPGVPMQMNVNNDSQDETGQYAQQVNIYVPVEVVTKEGSGPTFTRRLHKLEPIYFLKWRIGHVRRIFGKSGDWIDVFRSDQFISIEGSGPTFQVRFHSVLWEDPNPQTLDDFDDNLLDDGIPPSTNQSVGAAYRTDPLQMVVNISPGHPWLKVEWRLTWTGILGYTQAGPNKLPFDQFTLTGPASYNLSQNNMPVSTPMKRLDWFLYNPVTDAQADRSGLPIKIPDVIDGDTVKNLSGTVTSHAYVGLNLNLSGVVPFFIDVPVVGPPSNFYGFSATGRWVQDVGGGELVNHDFLINAYGGESTLGRFLTATDIATLYAQALADWAVSIDNPSTPGAFILSTVPPHFVGASDPIPYVQEAYSISLKVTSYAKGRPGTDTPPTAISSAEITLGSDGPTAAKRINISVSMDTLGVSISVGSPP